MSAATRLFKIQEICDHITDFLAASRHSVSDLKSSALVCPGLYGSAQTHIFRHIIIRPYMPDGSHYFPESHMDIWGMACFSLCSLLTASPHLIRLIRHLTVLDKSDMLSPLAKIAFTHLREISFENLKLTDSAFLAAQQLIGLATVRVLRLTNCDVVDLAALVAKSTTDFNALLLCGITILPPKSDLAVGTAAESAPQSKLKSIRLFNTAGDDWFLSHSCPFDLSRVVDVELASRQPSTSDKLVQLLHPARRSIQRLRVSWDLAAKIDLSQFPALVHLEIVMNTMFNFNIAIPPTLHAAAAQFLSFEIHGDRVAQVRKALEEVDRLVAMHPMPTLQRIEARIRIMNDAFTVKQMQLHLPQLETKDLTIVVEHAC
ncbi:hypothetical protein C8J57DRAFT_1326023, partial [Mycena rebaudengoi]